MKLAVICSKVAVCAAALAVSAAANAYVIGFNGLSGSNGDAYPGHSEGGFTVTPLSTWVEAHNFGNPIPDIFSTAAAGTIKVTGGTFTFASVDLGDAGNGEADWQIHGFLGASEVLTMSGVNIGHGFTTFLSTDPAEILDRLEITILRDETTSYNIDNINVNAVVPVPGTLALFGVALAGLGFARRRVRKN